MARSRTFNKYTVTQSLFTGPFSEVCLAHNPDPDPDPAAALCALKITVPCEDRPPHNSRHELDLLRRCAPCPRIVNVLDAFDCCNKSSGDLEQIVVMPHLPLDLTAVISHYARASYPPGSPRRNCMPLALARSIIVDICQALEFLHGLGVIHRDIKPSNVLFSHLPSNGGAGGSGFPRATVIDLGIAWCPDLVSATEPDPAHKICDVSTASYRAPELLLAKRDYADKIDMWSLGCVYAQMMGATGTATPFDPYTGDIALFSKQVRVLGAPSLDSWPEMATNDTFLHMSFTTTPTPPSRLQAFCSRAQDTDHTLISQLLTFQSTRRPSAAHVVRALAGLPLTPQLDAK